MARHGSRAGKSNQGVGSGVAAWLAGWLAGWPADWLTGSLAGWPAGQLAGLQRAVRPTAMIQRMITCCRPSRGGLLSPYQAVVANSWKRGVASKAQQQNKTVSHRKAISYSSRAMHLNTG